MTDLTPVDAGGNQPTEAAPETNNDSQGQTGQGADWWKSEAHRAFEKRDARAAEAKEWRAKYEQLAASKAEASDTVSARLAELTAERDNLQNKLSETHASHRESQILNKLTLGAPEASRQAVETLYRAHAPQLDDGEAEPASVAEKAETFLKQFAPTLFQTQVAPEKGRIPNDGGKPEFDAEAERRKVATELRKFNPAATGISL